MTIRTATLHDVEQIAALFDAYRVFYRKPSDVAAAKIFLSARLRNDESIIFVAEDANRNLVGFTQLYPLFSSTRMKPVWLLNDLFVQSSARGQGISKQLMERAQQHAKETRAAGLMLETEKNNEIGNNLYQSMGWEKDEEHNYYSWDC